MKKPLEGKKIGIVVENKFIPEEISAYQSVFPALGAELELLSRIWYFDFKPEKTTFYSDVDPTGSPAWETPHSITVARDISTVEPGDYAAVIMSANYTSVRLRYWAEYEKDFPYGSWQGFSADDHVRRPPVVDFFRRAMGDKKVVKGFLCHGLWILTPNPDLLENRTVVCHSVVMPDILNCKAIIKLDPPFVVTDDDMVTGFSKHEVLPFIDAIADGVVARAAS